MRPSRGREVEKRNTVLEAEKTKFEEAIKALEAKNAALESKNMLLDTVLNDVIHDVADPVHRRIRVRDK